MTLVSLQLVGTFLTYFIILYQFQSSERGTGQWTFPLKSAIKFYFNVHILHIIRFIWRTQTIQLHRYHGNTISKISRIVSLWIPCRILETGREWWRTSMKWQSAVWINRYELGRTFNHVMHLRWAVISGQPGRDPMRLFRAMTGECELEIGHLISFKRIGDLNLNGEDKRQRCYVLFVWWVRPSTESFVDLHTLIQPMSFVTWHF